MPFVNFRKKIRFFSIDFRQNFDVRTFPRWLSIRGTKFFWWAIQKFFFFKIFTLVLLDGFLDGFWKVRLLILKICILIWYFLVFFENYSMRMLSIRGYLGRIEYDFQKSHVTGPWDHMVLISAKKSQKKISCLSTFKSVDWCSRVFPLYLCHRQK
jgi:hypothetical protein